jgi:undecaprenyl-diphosphatase
MDMFLLDQQAFQFIYAAAHRNAFWNVLAIIFAEYLPYFMVAAFLVLVYYQKGWRRKVYLFCEAALAIILSRGILTEVIRYFYHEPRPFSFYGLVPLFNETSWSFPSGHAAWFFALAMAVWFANRKWGWWYFALALIMGVARVYAGVHWPIDIIGGAAIGVASSLFIHWLLKGNRKELERV